MFSLGVGSVLAFSVWYVLTRNWSGRDEIRAEDRADPSLDFDEPWPSGTHIVENGRAYDRAALPLVPAAVVILPEDQERTRITVRSDGPAGSVTVLLEKRLYWFGHPADTRRLRDFRAERTLWKHSAGATLVIAPPRGGSNIEGGSMTHTLVIAPPGVVVRREPLSASSFAGRYAEDRYVSDDEARSAGWEEVPQQPLPKTEWPLPIERPPPMNLPR